MSKEQASFEFGAVENEPEDGKPESAKKQGENGYEFAETDECPVCGKPFESMESCTQCRGNAKKKAFIKRIKREEK